MREIKFRAWDSDEKQMVSPDYIGRDGRAYWTCHSIPTSSEHVMQYIGLHDKNDKEIYEGDIIKTIPVHSSAIFKSYLLREIKFQNGCFVASSIDRPDLIAELSYYDRFQCDVEIEVIGNIHENPELMEGIK